MSIPKDDHATMQQKLQAKKTHIALKTSEAILWVVPLVSKPLTKDHITPMNQTMREQIKGGCGQNGTESTYSLRNSASRWPFKIIFAPIEVSRFLLRHI